MELVTSLENHTFHSQDNVHLKSQTKVNNHIKINIEEMSFRQINRAIHRSKSQGLRTMAN